MKDASNRRDFVKQLIGASLTPSLLRGSASASAAPIPPEASGAKVVLEPFDYQGVQLLDGMLKKQYEETRNYYFQIPDDNILKGFRQRAGLPAPGKEMGGWCRRDSAVVFG